ncbi:MAG TPA: DNA mismatch repair endonuclease MutL [Kofleriaceae bacterium]
MEPVIAVLPPDVIDQIAAGEVIERPASVVKELVDNAIDAGATAITVEVAGGGRGLVRVSDDGCGMSAPSAVLAFERHATSKLRVVDDLWGIASMGFRGEALPSIASVSKLCLVTRRAGDDVGTRVVFEAGRLVSVSDTGTPVGTTVEVSDLLFNLPARLKFLKGEATEASHVTELMGKVAMAFPRLHVRLKHNGRTALDIPPDRDGLARAQALLGARVAQRLAPAIGEESGVRVTAYLGAPELAQATTRGVQLFVGRRPVRDRGLLHALAMGYGELVPRGRYPLAIVLVDVPAGAVDVNVHPQKLEVRFSDAGAVTAAVRHVVQAGVAAAGWRAEAGGSGPVQVLASVAPPALPFDGHAATPLADRHVAQMRSRQVALGFGARGGDAEPAVPWPVMPPPVVQRSLDLPEPAKAPAEAGTDASAPRVHPRDWARSLREQTKAAREPTEPAPPAPPAPPAVSSGQAFGPAASSGFRYAVPPGSDQPDLYAKARYAAEPGAAIPSLGPPPAPSPPPEPVAAAEPGYFARLRYLGQVDLTYLACDGDGELVLIDQHAAHERVELARLRARHASDGGPRVAVQNMLFPVTLDATPAQLALVERVGGLLAQVGFEVEPFGPATLAVKAVPASMTRGHADPAQLLVRLLEDWAEAGAPNDPAQADAERVDALLGAIACHSVVRAGDRLTPREAEDLLRQLDGVDLSLPAPHGKAVLLRLALGEIGRRFGR